jgi:alpha-N-arabinofuranosidase
MIVQVDGGVRATHEVSEALLGHNLEAASLAYDSSDTVHALTADRLANAKFCGPADPQTGVAPGWRPTAIAHFQCEGASLSGAESQLIHSHGWWPAGICQTGRSVRRGETLEVELWAKVKSQPVSLRIEIGPLPVRQPCYDQATITVDAAYWKPYRATLSVPCDDNEAIFKCQIIGGGMLWIDQIHLRPLGEGHLCRRLLEKIETLRVPQLRFPGGCVSANYHWRLGTGPEHLRPVLMDPVFKSHIAYDFGTDEYLELCHSQQIRPHVTVNLGTGTPDEAAEWAAYCAAWFRRRGVEPPRAYFQVGNEHYTVSESAHMTGQMYVEALRAFVPLIRGAYPNARIIALGERDGNNPRTEQPAPWRRLVLEQAGDLFDVLCINRYSGQWKDAPADRLMDVADGVRNTENDLRELLADLRAHGLPQKIALTEWNFWLHASHQDGQGFYEPGDAQHGLFVAGMLHMFARLAPDLELANFYHLVNVMGVFRRQGATVTETSLADVFRLYRPAFPGEFLPLEMNSPTLGAQAPAVDGLAIQCDKSIYLFLVNRSPAESATVALPPFFSQAVAATMLVGQSPLGPLLKQEIALPGDILELPPLAISRLQYDLARCASWKTRAKDGAQQPPP